MKVLKQREKLESAGATAVFVVHDDPDSVRAGLLRDLDVPFAVLVDLDREAYRAWGLRRSSVAGVWLDPRVWVRYARLMIGGERIRSLGRDTLQLGGDFVIAADGRVAYARPQQRDDRPPVAVLTRHLVELGTP